MKKIVTFAMALCLAAGASATPQFVGMKPQSASGIQQEMPMEQNIVLPNLPKDAEIEAEVMAQMPKLRMIDPKDLEANQFTNKSIRKAAQGTTTNISFNKAVATYLGTLYTLNYGSATPAWNIMMTNGSNDTIQVVFVGYSNQYIEGYYRGVKGAVQMNGKESVEINGTLQIDYKAVGTSTSPTYTFAAVLQDKEGNTYNVSGDYAFENTDKKVEVMDLGYYYLYMTAYSYCYYYKQYCDEADAFESMILITLKDAPVTASGITVPINIEVSAIRSFGGDYWYVYANDNNAINSVGYYEKDFDKAVGTYSTQDFYLRYTKLFAIAGDTTKIEVYKPESLEVNQSGDTTYYTETVMGRDGNKYVISMFYVEPEATDTVTVFTYGNFDDNALKEGIFMGAGVSTDATYYASFAVNTEKAAGTYTTKDSYNGGYYDYIAYFKAGDTTYYDVILDTIKITEVTGTKKDTADYIASIRYKAQNTENRKDVKWFNITMVLVSMYKYDENVAVSQTYTQGTDAIQFETSAFNSNGYIYFQAQKADKSDYFYAIIYPEKLDATYTLPLGEYKIDNTEDENTFYASPGYSIIKQAAYPSFYATIKNKTMDKIWFITSGTFTMEAKKMTLNGMNSLGKSVTIEFNMPYAALEDITAGNQEKAAKMMYEGQVVIMKNGKLYNALGVEIAK